MIRSRIRGLLTPTLAFGAVLSALLGLPITPPEEVSLGLVLMIGVPILLLALSCVSVGSLAWSAGKLRLLALGGCVSMLLIAAVMGLLYIFHHRTLTFAYPYDQPTGRYVAGTELTTEAQGYRQGHPSNSTSELVARYGGLAHRTRVFTERSLYRAATQLAVEYGLLVLSLAGAAYFLAGTRWARLRAAREEIYERLCRMPPPLFEEVIFRAQVTPSILSPSTAAQSTRAIELVRLTDASEILTFEDLQRYMDETMHEHTKDN